MVDADAGGLLAYNYLSGEPITGLEAGRPLLTRGPDSRFTLANLMRAQVYSAFATLSLGMGILRDEGVAVDVLLAAYVALWLNVTKRERLRSQAQVSYLPGRPLAPLVLNPEP